MEILIKALDILAWLLTVIIVTWIMRKPIQSLIPLIHKLKYQGLEVEFLNTLELAKDSVQDDSQIDYNPPKYLQIVVC